MLGLPPVARRSVRPSSPAPSRPRPWKRLQWMITPCAHLPHLCFASAFRAATKRQQRRRRQRREEGDYENEHPPFPSLRDSSSSHTTKSKVARRGAARHGTAVVISSGPSERRASLHAIGMPPSSARGKCIGRRRSNWWRRGLHRAAVEFA